MKPAIHIKSVQELENYISTDNEYYFQGEFESISISGIDIEKPLNFYECFVKKFIYIYDCNFTDQLLFTSVNYEKLIIIEHCKSNSSVFFHTCNFYKAKNSTTSSVSIKSSKFIDLHIDESAFSFLNIFSTEFKGDIYLGNSSKFLHNVVLNNVTIEGHFNLKNIIFSSESILNFNTVKCKNLIEIENIESGKISVTKSSFEHLMISNWVSGRGFFSHLVEYPVFIDHSSINEITIAESKISSSEIRIEFVKVNVMTLVRINESTLVSLRNIEPIGIQQDCEIGYSELNIFENNLAKSRFIEANIFEFDKINIIDSKIYDLFLIDYSINVEIRQKLDRIRFDKPKYSHFINTFQKLETDTKKIHLRRKEVLRQFKVIYAKANDKTNERIFHALEMEEYLKIPNLPFWDKLILKISKCSSDFGQNIWRPFVFNGIINLVLFIIFFALFNKEGYRIDFSNHSWDVFWKGVNIFFAKWLFPIKLEIKNSYTLLEAFFSANSGLFFYNVIRASRKFYH